MTEAVRGASGRKGVDAVSDAVGGGSWRVGRRCLAPGGAVVGDGLQCCLDNGGSTLSAMAGFARLRAPGRS